MQETWVQFLGREDSLEEEMATCSSTLAWKIPRTEEPGRLQSRVTEELDMTEHTQQVFHSVLYFPSLNSEISVD